jgi:hypothetical protein
MNYIVISTSHIKICIEQGHGKEYLAAGVATVCRSTNLTFWERWNTGESSHIKELDDWVEGEEESDSPV